MDKYISIEARHVAALILIKARSGIRPPVMRNVKVIHYVVPRTNRFGLPPGKYYKVVEEWRSVNVKRIWILRLLNVKNKFFAVIKNYLILLGQTNISVNFLRLDRNSGVECTCILKGLVRYNAGIEFCNTWLPHRAGAAKVFDHKRPPKSLWPGKKPQL